MMQKEKKDHNKKNHKQKFPLWLLVLIIILLVFSAYLVLQNTKNTNIDIKTTNFSYKF
jgi:uncharacterized membrane protein YadS